ncbi:hypothetical protein KAU19_05975, partial [Candidatus Parcubacteria bacterium]|nr:hypothetical protein [Candidatus Parcubacteria bacterium]
NKLKIILTFLKSAASVFIMVLAILFLKQELNLFLTIVIAGIIYLTVLFSIGGFKKEDIISMYHALIKKQKI